MPVLWWQHIELPRRRVDVTPDLALQWRFAPAPCLAVRPGLQCLWFCVGGFLSPASELDAAGALGQGRCSACRQWCSYSFARVNARGFDFSRIGVCDHACKPKTVKVSGTAEGNRSGYDFLIIALFSWITLSRHDTHIRKEDQDREDDLEVARGPMVAGVSAVGVQRVPLLSLLFCFGMRLILINLSSSLVVSPHHAYKRSEKWIVVHQGLVSSAAYTTQ